MPGVLTEENEAKIHFDDESHIRVLHPDKFNHTQELAEQCTSFVEKIELFSSDVHVLVEVLDAQAKKIEFEKLKAIGQRNAVESEIENRENKKKAMQAQINEKLSELERFNKQYQSLQQIESEQNALIERLSNNET